MSNPPGAILSLVPLWSHDILSARDEAVSARAPRAACGRLRRRLCPRGPVVERVIARATWPAGRAGRTSSDPPVGLRSGAASAPPPPSRARGRCPSHGTSCDGGLPPNSVTAPAFHGMTDIVKADRCSRQIGRTRFVYVPDFPDSHLVERVALHLLYRYAPFMEHAPRRSAAPWCDCCEERPRLVDDALSLRDRPSCMPMAPSPPRLP